MIGNLFKCSRWGLLTGIHELWFAYNPPLTLFNWSLLTFKVQSTNINIQSVADCIPRTQNAFHSLSLFEINNKTDKKLYFVWSTKPVCPLRPPVNKEICADSCLTYQHINRSVSVTGNCATKDHKPKLTAVSFTRLCSNKYILRQNRFQTQETCCDYISLNCTMWNWPWTPFDVGEILFARCPESGFTFCFFVVRDAQVDE